MDPNVDDRPGPGQGDAPLPLFTRFPRLAAVVPHMALARLPTPVESLSTSPADSWIKRDDRSATIYGGNKVRKLEFLLAAARAADAGRLITIGAIGSHHALSTTIYGVRAGFRVTVVLMPQIPTEHVRAVLLAMAAHGAEVRIVRRPAAVPAAVLAARIAHRRERLYTIAVGGSDAIGTLGYVNAGLELERQCAAGLLPVPREVHVAGGTLGTAVGLAVGFAIAGLPTRVVAHRITTRAFTNDRRARRLARETLALLAGSADDARGLPTVDDVVRRFRIDHRAIGRGYGYETEAAVAARDWFAARTGLDLDLTYTAKAAAGFLAAAREPGAGPLLYWHTLSSVEPVPGPDAGARLPATARRFF